eukprot:6181089-Pleurochrysis_carterae.AAC.3
MAPESCRSVLQSGTLPTGNSHNDLHKWRDPCQILMRVERSNSNDGPLPGIANIKRPLQIVVGAGIGDCRLVCRVNAIVGLPDELKLR